MGGLDTIRAHGYGHDDTPPFFLRDSDDRDWNWTANTDGWIDDRKL